MENIKNQNINNVIESFVCPICLESFNSEISWMKHMKIHIPSNTLDTQDVELKEIYDTLNNKFSNIQVKISNGISRGCKYIITLTTKDNTKIDLKYNVPNETKGGNLTYPNNTKELIDDINYILNTIENINNSINKENNFYDFQCLEYCSYTNILENKFVFQFKLNPNDKDYIKEAFYPSEEDIGIFLNMLNKYIVTEIQGDVYVDNIDNGGWGDTFYIDNIDIENLMKRAMHEGKQVLLKII